MCDCINRANEHLAKFNNDTYDVDCDQDGFFSRSTVGYGKTEALAIQDLKDQMSDAQ